MQSPTAAGRYWTIRAANRLATAAVARLESLPPSVELHLIRASLAQSGGRKTDAVTELRAADTLSPGNTVIETALADALVQAHALDEAVPMLERLTHQRGADSALLLLYGEALLEDQQIERAIPILEQAVAAKNVSIPAHAALGRAYVQSGSYEQAVKHLNAAAKDDESGDVHYQLARAFQALGRQEDARAALAEYQKRHQRAAEPTPTDAVLTPPRR
jgi:predicted Zn-dependent protease